MKSVYYGESAQDLFFLILRGLRFELWGGGREGGRGHFIKILTFWFLSTKSGGNIETAGRRAESQRYPFNPEENMSFTACSLSSSLSFYLSLYLSAHFIFKGNRHLFLWQRQCSMDQLTGKAVSFYRKKRQKKERKMLCSILAWETKLFFPRRNFLILAA